MHCAGTPDSVSRFRIPAPAAYRCRPPIFSPASQARRAGVTRTPSPAAPAEFLSPRRCPAPAGQTGGHPRAAARFRFPRRISAPRLAVPSCRLIKESPRKAGVQPVPSVFPQRRGSAGFRFSPRGFYLHCAGCTADIMTGCNSHGNSPTGQSKLQSPATIRRNDPTELPARTTDGTTPFSRCRGDTVAQTEATRLPPFARFPVGTA